MSEAIDECHSGPPIHATPTQTTQVYGADNNEPFTLQLAPAVSGPEIWPGRPEESR
jgi:hypothetical protein